ncbi:hypothetical protein HY639_05810 [Candidatus Woesearchaeota archaeon]|nr:hypothetical protein [Candidatus Woesearchaeota archaeon]
MNKSILSFIVVLVALVGCTAEDVTEETQIEEVVVQEPVEEQQVEKIVEKLEMPTEKVIDAPEEKPAEKPVEGIPVEEKQPVEEKVAEPVQRVEQVVKEAPPRVYKGRITTLNPIKNGVYTGELTDMETYKHYPFTTSVEIIRGDIVTFTLSNDAAKIIAKEADPRLQKNETATEDTSQPAGTELARVKTVISSRDGLRGTLRNSRTGDEFRYLTNSLKLVVGDNVYYTPGDEPVTLVKIAK